jgi:hypothetical protein
MARPVLHFIFHSYTEQVLKIPETRVVESPDRGSASTASMDINGRQLEHSSYCEGISSSKGNDKYTLLLQYQLCKPCPHEQILTFLLISAS